MALRQVVEVTCDRCKKVENQVPAADPTQKPEFELSFMGKKLVFTDLCLGCRKVLSHLMPKIAMINENPRVPVAATDKPEEKKEEPLKRGLFR